MNSLAGTLVISFRIKSGNRSSQNQLFMNLFARSGQCSVPNGNDYLFVHFIQSLIVTPVICSAAPRSHLAFRLARS